MTIHRRDHFPTLYEHKWENKGKKMKFKIDLPIRLPSPNGIFPPAANAMFPFCHDDVQMQLHKRYVYYSPNSPIPPEGK